MKSVLEGHDSLVVMVSRQAAAAKGQPAACVAKFTGRPSRLS